MRHDRNERCNARHQSGFAIIAVLLLVGVIGMISATYLRNVILDSGNSAVGRPAIDAREAVHSGLQWGRQALRSGTPITSTTVSSGSRTATVTVTDLPNDRASILSRAIDSNGLGATVLTETSRRREAITESPDSLPSLDAATIASLLADPTVPKLYFSGTQRIEDTDLTGLIIVQDYAALYLDNVTVHGSIVSQAVLDTTTPLGDYDPISAPAVILDGNLRIEPADFLPGVAMLLPDGVVRDWTSATSVQIEGDVIAHTVMLDTVSGSCLGNIACVAPLGLSPDVELPGSTRAPRDWAGVLDMSGAWDVETMAYIPRVMTSSDVSAIAEFEIP